MGDFSRSPLDQLIASQNKGYMGVHIEQGVPLLDRDLNLLHDLIAATVRSLFTHYIGSGLAAGVDGFIVQAIPGGNDFRISAGPAGTGSCLVGGLEVTITGDVLYSAQPGSTPLTTPTATQPDPRIDTVYLDVWLVEIDGSTDDDLNNKTDVGLQTSVRTKPAWLVRVAEGVPVPAPGPGHAFYSLAELRRPRNNATIGATMITDLRQGRLTMADIERRLSIVERLLLLPAFVPPPAPQFLPKSGFINQNITLNGSNFNVGSPQVLFGNVAAHIVGLPTATQIVVQVPPGLTPGGTPVGVTITVTNAGGTDVSDDIFTALPGPAFAASGSQFTPTSGNPGQNVTLNGFNFNVGTPQALFGTVAAATVGTPTNTQMVVQVPAGVVPPGVANVTVKITVNTSSGSVTSDDSFTVNVDLPAPAFAAPPQFLPKSGRAGQTITLNGSNFNVGTPVVKFDDVTAQISGAPSATQIAVQVPAGLVPAGNASRTAHISVTTPGGTATSTDIFTALP